MNDLIHRIVEIIIEAGQSDTKKFGLGETIRYSPSEILEILKQHESEIFGEESSAQTNTSNTLNALDCISRQAAIDALGERPDVWTDSEGELAEARQWEYDVAAIKAVPPAQPEGIYYFKLSDEDYEKIAEQMRKTPIVLTFSEPERKTGKWIVVKNNGRVIEYKCSECGRTIYDDAGYDVSIDYPYCHCGLKMEAKR